MSAVKRLMRRFDRGSVPATPPGPRRTTLPATFKLVGVILFVTGLQTWALHHSMEPELARANDNLELLQQETVDREYINRAMSALRDYWRVSDNDAHKRQALELRDNVLQQYAKDARAAVNELASAVGGFDANSVAEKESLNVLIQTVAALQRIYTDGYGPVIGKYTHPSWYYQPGATLWQFDHANGQTLRFNQAIYLMLIGNRDASNAILDELRQTAHSSALRSRVLYTQARLQFDAYELEKDASYFRESLRFVRRSASTDAGYAPAKLLLEYLLSVDQGTERVDMSPVQGEGAGEGQGERGAISTESKEF